ncbi:hypothetical protein LJC48_05815, partial [Desulfovibrio sp. OttesenSCG-928-C06]|nr:hypothetical protein [Desulfovibrio sp. OttesenSCG-928-C06]
MLALYVNIGPAQGRTHPGGKSVNHPELELEAPPKKKTRWPLYLLLLILLGAGAAAAWGGWQYTRSGEVVIPVPEQFAEKLDELLKPDREGRLGPLRFDGEYFRAKSPSHTLAGELLRRQDQPGSTDAGQVGSGGQGLPADGSSSWLTTPGALPTDSGTQAPTGQQAAAAQPDGNGQPERAPVEVYAGGTPVEALPDQRLAQVPAATDAPANPPAPPADNTVPGSLYVTPRDTAEIPPAPVFDDARQTPARQAQVAPPQDAAPTVTATLSSSDEPKDLIPVPQPTTSPAARITRQKVYSGEDSVVTLDFIDDLAGYLVRNYWPAGSHPSAREHGVSTAGIKSANQRYGIDLKGFAGSNTAVRDYYRDRGLILSYVFMPSMIEALSNLYADRFADALVQAAARPIVSSSGVERHLTPADTAEMLEYYAGYSRSLGSALLAYANNTDAPSVVNVLNRAEMESFAAHTRYLDAKLAQEVAQEAGDNERMAEAEKDAVRLERVYHLSRGKQKSSEDAVYQMMLQGNARNLDRTSLIYIACWLNRRGPDSYYAVKAAANSTAFVADVLAEKARELR